MPALAFTLATLAVCAAAALGAASLRLQGVSFALAAYLLGWAAVVGLAEALSAAGALDRGGYVIGSALLFAAAAAVWHRRGRPRPALPSLDRGALRVHPQVAVLAAVVLLAVVYEAFLAVATPPNNYDSLTYHLPRVVAWLQQGHIGYFDAATARANAFPGNAEVGILFTVALLGRDTLAALPQFAAELAILAGVYGISRRLGFGRAGALLAALLTATLSQVALQSVTTQNDLVVTSFVAAAVYFVLGRERHELPLAGLAAALAVGTKLTGILALPILVAAAVLLLPRRRVAELAVWGAAAFVLFGSFWYVENTVRTHHPLGVVPEADPYRPDRTVGDTASTAARVGWRFVDFTGLNPPVGLVRGLQRTGSQLFAAAHIDPNPVGATSGPYTYSFSPTAVSSEDTSYFGILGFLLLLPVGAVFAVAWLCRRTSRARGLLAVSLPVFLLVIALTQSYNDYLGRFMIIPVALTMPLVASLYDRRLRLLTLGAVGAGIATLAGTHANNIGKPTGLAGGPAVWEMPRAQVERLTAGSIAHALPLVNRAVPASGTLGIVVGTNDPSYLLYGPRLGRRLVTLTSTREAAARGIRWIAVSPDRATPNAAGWRVQSTKGGWQLLSEPARTLAHAG